MLVAAEQARDDVAEARSEWLTEVKKLDSSKLVFIDEYGFDTTMTRGFGRSDRGAPCIGTVPHGRWGNNTFVAGLRANSTYALMFMQGAMNGEWFAL